MSKWLETLVAPVKWCSLVNKLNLPNSHFRGMFAVPTIKLKLRNGRLPSVQINQTDTSRTFGGETGSIRMEHLGQPVGSP